MGMSMVIIYCILICGHIVYVAAPVLHCCGCFVLLIIAPIMMCRLSAEQEQNRKNVAKLPEFDALNDCADSLTNIDSDLVAGQLDQALDASQAIDTWLTITWVVFAIEIVSFIVALCCLFINPIKS